MGRKALRMVLFSQVTYCGGYSGEDPPLPIPNREVKLTRADGTDPPVGRVGRRRFSEARTSNETPGLLRLCLAQTVVNKGMVVCRRNSAFSEREREEMDVPAGMTASV